MEKTDDETSTSDKARRELNRFTGIDFCTFANALREAATEIKGNCLSYKYVASPDIEALLINTEQFLEAALLAWKAIQKAVKEDIGNISIYKMLEDHRL